MVLKYLTYLFISVVAAFNCALADDIESEVKGNSMFASFSFHPMQINNNLTYIAGGRLLYFINQRYAFGLGSFNMVSRNIKADFIDTVANNSPTLEYNFFSSDFEYHFNPERYYSMSIRTSMSLAHVKYNLISTEKSSTELYYPDYGEDWFFFVEPSVNLTLNMTSWMKTSIGLGYRIAVNGDYRYNDTKFGNKQLSGLSGGVYLYLGNF